MNWFLNLVGGKSMTALAAGTQAPDFNLSSVDGKPFSLRDALAQGPVVAAFF